MNLFFSITCDKVNCRFLNGSKIGLFISERYFWVVIHDYLLQKIQLYNNKMPYGYLSTIFHILNGLALLASGWAKKHPSTNKQNKESCDFDLSTEKTQKISDWHQSILTCHSGLKSFTNEHSYFYISYYLVHKVQSFLKQWMHYLQ